MDLISVCGDRLQPAEIRRRANSAVERQAIELEKRRERIQAANGHRSSCAAAGLMQK